MTNLEALGRAPTALRRAIDDTDNLDHGDMASHEVERIIKCALRAEFGTAADRCKNGCGKPRRGAD